MQGFAAAWCVVQHAVTLPECFTLPSSPISLLMPHHPHPHPHTPAAARRRPPSPLLLQGDEEPPGSPPLRPAVDLQRQANAAIATLAQRAGQAGVGL